ncbi:MAG: hypothetical protein OFPI_33950 [Osedax symbiont Rs2]|nr:MAG: hypothetical protein OFPI_33950 [Osedax symbiont Rs2]
MATISLLFAMIYSVANIDESIADLSIATLMFFRQMSVY